MKLSKNIISSNFGRNVLTLSGGTAFVQVLGILLSPIITRLYSPEEFGILTIYTAILGTLAIIGSLKYELGIPIADNDTKAINVLTLCLIVLFIYVGIILTVILTLGDKILVLVSGDILIPYKYFIVLGIFLIGLYNIFSQWAFRKKSYITLTKTKVNQSLGQNITIICLGLFHCGPVGLIMGQVLAQSTGITTLARPILQLDKAMLKQVNIKEIAWCARRYAKFPLYSSFSQLLNTIGLQLPIFFITSLYGSNIVGLFGLANTMVNMPVNLIGKSVGSVFYGEAANIGRENPEALKKLSVKLFKKLILFGLIPVIPIVLFGPFLFSFVFGESWYKAGVFGRILTMLVYSRFIFLPVSRVFDVYERQKEALFLDVIRVIIVLVVFIVVKFSLIDSYWAVGLYSISMSIIYFLTFLIANRIMNDEIKKYKFRINGISGLKS
jgi:O-antigen/teichoic acid export membrane protein